jgi:outer membrane protein OmpA-like peptidoglycan-associated protein
MDVLNMLKSQFSPALVGKIANAIGVDEGTVQKALGGAIPALLAGFVEKASSAELGSAETEMTALPAMGDGEEAMNALSDPEKATQVASVGSGMVDGIFGDKLDGVAGWLSHQFGVEKTAALGLLATLAPVVLGFVKRIAGGDLNGFLAGLAPGLAGMLPGGLGSALGVPDVRVPAAEAPIPRAAVPVDETASSGGIPAWIWLIPVLIIGGWAIWKATQSGGSGPEETQPTVTQPAVTSPETTAPSGEMHKDLPGGVSLDFPAGSVEDDLIAFIEDPSRQVDKDTWFTFDRLEFDTGKATIRPESMERIDAIAKIMAAYPNVHLKIGGYTDNTGDPAANMKLSQDRAEATMSALVDKGIAADRLEAEGYGEQHPKASNDTDEGRQQNRRIDVRVTQK